MNPKCEKWHGQLKHLREKHAEFRQAYADALKFAEENPKVKETSFGRCRELFYEIKTLVLDLREDFPRLTKEQLAELATLRTRFDEQPRLHMGINWEDVEKALLASRDSINKLMALDEKGHKMNVFGEENGEFIFVSAWHNSRKLNQDHGEICYDRESQNESIKRGYKTDGNAVDIANSMGVDLAEPKFHQHLVDNLIDVDSIARLGPDLGKFAKAGALMGIDHYKIQSFGSAWLKTDTATRKTGKAFIGDTSGVGPWDAFYISGFSFRAQLRVKKV